VGAVVGVQSQKVCFRGALLYFFRNKFRKRKLEVEKGNVVAICNYEVILDKQHYDQKCALSHRFRFCETLIKVEKDEI